MIKDYTTDVFTIDNTFLPFIVLEGPDGVGKSTQAALLLQKMPDIAKKVNIQLKEYVNLRYGNVSPELIYLTDVYKPIKAPDYSYPEGIAIKHGLFNGFKSDLDRNILYIKDRVGISSRILDSVAQGCSAGYIGDRWSLSQYVYEIQLGASPLASCALIYEYEYGFHENMVSPDFTIVLLGDADTLSVRMKAQRGDNLDDNEKDTQGQIKRIELYKGVVNGDIEVALHTEALNQICGDLYSYNIANLSIEDIHEALLVMVEERLFSLIKRINKL